MGTIKNFRTTADVTMNTRLKDGGIYIDWAGLTDIRAWIYSDAQKALAGRVDVTIDQQDSTKAVLVYAGTKAQYPGINRLIVQARYNGSLKTYDKAVFNFVPRTAEATGNVTIDEPETDVEIVVQDVSSSILDATILAALAAADRANEAAEAAEHMVDIHTGPQGPAGKSPYIDETTGHWFIYDDETGEYVDSGNVAKGDTGNGIASWTVVESQEDGGSNTVTVTFTDGTSETFTYKNGHTGATPNLTIGTVETGAAGSQAEATITGTAANPVLNLRIPQGVPGVVQAKYVEVDTLPTASASTMNALYLVPSQVQGSYDIYYTSQDGRETYSWVFLCGTTIQLSDYATKAEVDQLEHEVKEDGFSVSTFDHSTFTQQTPNITLSSPLKMEAAGDYIEIKANANGTDRFILRDGTAAYNHPAVRYSAANTIIVRFSPSVQFSFQDVTKIFWNQLQIIKIALVSVSGGTYSYDIYVNGEKVGSQNMTATTAWNQIGYNSVMDLYYIKAKLNGTDVEYTKFSQITGAVGISDVYSYKSYDGLIEINDRVDALETESAKLDKAVFGADMYYQFATNIHLYSCVQGFWIYQRIKGNIYAGIALAYYILASDIYPNGYWRIERTNIVSITDGVVTTIKDQAIVAGENEFVLQWLAGAGYNASGGYTGGFHFGEKIDGVTGAWVEFVADGNTVATDTDIPLTPCKSFYYRERSAIYNCNDTPASIAAWHIKETTFKDCGYETINSVDFVQALDYFAYTGIVCVSRWLSEYAMPEGVAEITDMGDGEPTITQQFKSNGHCIHYEGNGYCTDVESEVLFGADDSLCERVVYNSTSYNKFYRRNPDTTGSLSNRMKGRCKVKISPQV